MGTGTRKVSCDSRPGRQKRPFMPSAYHAALHPFIFQDADGRFRGLDKNIEQAKGFTNYTTFSLWDTYRALHPWFNLVHQDVNADIANSMLAHYDKSTGECFRSGRSMATKPGV